MTRVFKYGIIGFFAVFGFVTCKHKPDVIPSQPVVADTTHKPSPVTTTCSPDTVYFTNTILPMIVSNCAKAGCHDAISSVEGLNLTSYANIMRLVRAGSPGSSRLYTVMSSSREVMPPSGKLSQAELDLLSKWITQGAKNNTCTDGSGTCDSVNVSYTNSLVPIINTYCKGCHNSSTLSGSVNLDNYNGVLTVANNGQLMGGLTGKLSAMPKYGASLSPCDIALFRNWIKEGAKNN